MLPQITAWGITDSIIQHFEGCAIHKSWFCYAGVILSRGMSFNSPINPACNASPLTSTRQFIKFSFEF